jgi:photosystem II stability/assembly factor-like uncharacterized protein
MSRTKGLVFFSFLPALFLLTLALGSPVHWAHAGINDWAGLGPGGGLVRALAPDPQNPGTLYAGKDGGVFKSTDGGAHWSAMMAGLTSTNISVLAIDPRDSNTVYAGTEGGGVFKSTNGGAHWSPINTGLIIRWDAAYVIAFAIDPSDPNILFAGTWGVGVFKSTDGGAHWTPMTTGLTTSYVYMLVIDPLNPDILYAETHGGGVFKSTDGGTLWVPMNTGLTNLYAAPLVIDPLVPDTLYVGGGNGVFKSTNGGAEWSALIGSYVPALAIDPSNPSTVYAGSWGNGVYKSTDGGAHWSIMTSGLDTLVAVLAVDPFEPNTLYAGTLTGVYKSTDGGKHWDAINQVGPDLSISPKSIDFGDVSVGNSSDQTITLKNLGNTDLVIGAILPPSSPFGIAADVCSGHTLAPDESCTVAYLFSPLVEGSFTGTSIIPSNDPGKKLTEVSLSGVGAAILLQSPADGEIFPSSSFIVGHQASFEWIVTGTFLHKCTIAFSASPTDFSKPIFKTVIRSADNRWTPPINAWRKIMKSSQANGAVRDIYWKVIGIRPDRTSAVSEARRFRIGNPQAAAIITPPNGAILDSQVPPAITMDWNGNVQLRLEFSPSLDFSNPKTIKTFNARTKDPNAEPSLTWTPTLKQWNKMRNLVRTSGYFRVTAWDRIGRESVSGESSFTVDPGTVGLGAALEPRQLP